MGDSTAQEFLDYLRNHEILSAAQIRHLDWHRGEKRRTVGQSLLELSLMDEATFLAHWSAMKNLKVLSAQELNPGPLESLLISRETCLQFGILPLSSQKGFLTVATSDPTHGVAEDELRFLTGMDVAWAPAASGEIRAAIDRFFPPESPATEDSGVVEDVELSPVISEVQRILLGALEAGASHIHLEPTAEAFILLYRLEGALKEIRRIPTTLQAGITARLKILGELDIAERRVPQGGTIRFRQGNRKADFEVSTLPTAFYRERITLSVLDVGRPVPPPEKLGLDPEVSGRVAQIVRA